MSNVFDVLVTDLWVGAVCNRFMQEANECFFVCIVCKRFVGNYFVEEGKYFIGTDNDDIIGYFAYVSKVAIAIENNYGVERYIYNSFKFFS